MKSNKNLKMILTVLVIIMLAIASFFGIFVKDKNKYSNIVKDYKFGADLKGSRLVQLKVSDSTKTVKYDAEGKEIDSSNTTTEPARTEEKPVNSEETLTKDNYKASKDILEKRITSMGLDYYEIRLDEENGQIAINIPEDENTDSIVSELQNQGKFEIVDSETKEVLMDNSDIASVKAGYGSYNSSTSVTVYFNIEFNKEGTEKFKDITNKYVETKGTKTVKDETTGEEKQEETTEKKEVTLMLDDSEMLTTHFEKEVSNGILQLSLGTNKTEETEEIQDHIKKANNLKTLLENGKMPLVYTSQTNQFVESEISSENITLLICVFVVYVLIGILYILIKYKAKGIWAPVYLTLHIAALLLIIRYTNTVLTIGGLIAIAVSYTIGYIAMLNRIKSYEKISDKKEAYKKSMLHTLSILIPAFIIAIVFTLNGWQTISSFGTVMFWGTIVSLLYMI